MYTTVNENGNLNNYAKEPQIHYADYPSLEQQSRYALQGAVATLFVCALVLISCGVS